MKNTQKPHPVDVAMSETACPLGDVPTCLGNCSLCLEPAKKAPQWATTPPTEPGWYWTRHVHLETDEPVNILIAHFDGEFWAHFGFINEEFFRREYWPVRIEEPPR